MQHLIEASSAWIVQEVWLNNKVSMVQLSLDQPQKFISLDYNVFRFKMAIFFICLNNKSDDF